MEEKDNIKELFNNRFSDFEADVDAQVWDNIQSELANGVGSASSTGAGSSLLGKSAIWIAAVSVSALIGVGYFVLDAGEASVPVPNTELVDNSTTPINKVSKGTDKQSLKSTNSENKTSSVSKEQIIDVVIVPTKKEDIPVAESFDAIIEEVPNNKIARKTSENRSDKLVEENQVVKTPTMQPEMSTEFKATTPNKIEMATQSSVLAMPMGGTAPLDVAFSTLAENPVTIKWDFDDGNKSDEVSPNHMYQNPGLYFVTMIAQLENGEIVMDKAVVEVKAKQSNTPEVTIHSKIKVPNIFTPNGDGEHDQLVIICEGMQSFSMSVYSVSGKLVFQTNNPQEYWDGTDKYGNQVVEGTYYYLVNAIGEDRNIYAPKGYITIRR